MWSPLLGGALLLLADGSLLVMARYIAEVPTGTATAFFGAFLLLVLSKNMPLTALHAEARMPNSSPRHRPHCALLIAIVVMGAIAVFSLTEHLFIDNLPTAELFSGRWPLVLAAASAGAMLALAGTIMQSVTANPLASPEGLRVSASAAPRRSRTWLLSLAALLTAAATLIVGPMSFVGLIAPHIAAMTTPPKPLNRALCAAAAGAALMTAADWHGRSIHFS